MPRISPVISLFVNLCIHFEKGEEEKEREKRRYMCSVKIYYFDGKKYFNCALLHRLSVWKSECVRNIFAKQKESSRKYIAKLIIRNYRGSNSPSSPSLFPFTLFFSPYLFPPLSPLLLSSSSPPLPSPLHSFSPSPSSSLSRDNYIFLTSNYKKLRLRKL